MTRVRHRFSALERARLWLSYQRFAMGFALASTGVAYVSLKWLPWWTWPIAALAIAKMLMFSVFIASRHGRKVRATAIGALRIAQGRFKPASVQAYCGDPCFRVVATELLSRAGYSGTERRALVRDFTRIENERASATVIFDRRNNRVVTTSGGTTVSSSLTGQ